MTLQKWLLNATILFPLIASLKMSKRRLLLTPNASYRTKIHSSHLTMTSNDIEMSKWIKTNTNSTSLAAESKQIITRDQTTQIASLTRLWEDFLFAMKIVYNGKRVKTDKCFVKKKWVISFIVSRKLEVFFGKLVVWILIAQILTMGLEF